MPVKTVPVSPVPAAPLVPGPPDPEKARFRRTTLREQGLRLPTGLPAGTARAQDLSFRPWRFREEKEVAELVEKLDAGDRFGDYVSCVLATLLSHVAGTDLAARDPTERVLFLRQLAYGDVIYAYCRLRYEVLGAEVYFPPVSCPACRTLIENVAADLGNLGVKVPADPGREELLVPLRDGFSYLGQLHKTALLRAARWEVFQGTAAERGGPWLTEQLLLTSIVGLEHVPAGETVTLTPELLDEVSKRDLAALQRAADGLSGGPDMSLDLTCPAKKCGRTFSQPVDWEYASFFGRSSR